MIQDDELRNMVYNNEQEKLKEYLDKLTSEMALGQLTDQDKFRNSLLHRSVDQPEIIKLFLDKIPSDKLLYALTLPNGCSITPLHFASGKNPGSFKLMLKALPKEQRIPAVEYRDQNGLTSLLYASNISTIKRILRLYPRESRVEKIIYHSDEYDENLFHYYADNDVMLKQLLKLTSPHNPYAALTKEGQEGRTPIYIAKSCPKALGVLLDSLKSEEDIIAAISIRVWPYQTILHSQFTSAEGVLCVLERLSYENKLKAMKIPDKFDGSIPLHTISRQKDFMSRKKAPDGIYDENGHQSIPHFLKLVLGKLKYEDRMPLLITKGNTETEYVEFRTPLDYIIQSEDLDAIKSLFELLQESNIQKICYIYASRPKYLNLISQCYPITEKTDLIHYSEDGISILQKSLESPEATRLLLKPYLNRNPMFLNVISASDSLNKDIFDHACELQCSYLYHGEMNADAIFALLSYIPSANRLPYLKKPAVHKILINPSLNISKLLAELNDPFVTIYLASLRLLLNTKWNGFIDKTRSDGYKLGLSLLSCKTYDDIFINLKQYVVLHENSPVGKALIGAWGLSYNPITDDLSSLLDTKLQVENSETETKKIAVCTG